MLVRAGRVVDLFVDADAGAGESVLEACVGATADPVSARVGSLLGGVQARRALEGVDGDAGDRDVCGESGAGTLSGRRVHASSG